MGRTIAARVCRWMLVLATAGCSSAGDDVDERVATVEESAWGVQQKLVAGDGGPSHSFGTSVAVSGDTAIVGAPGQFFGRGAAYVFIRSGETWTLQQKLLGDDFTNQLFGFSVAVDGDTAIVGAPGLYGSFYVFTRTIGVWSLQNHRYASDFGVQDDFGRAVALDGDTAIVGARHWEGAVGDNLGAAYVCERNLGGPGRWGERTKLTAANGQDGEDLGTTVAIAGDIAVIGAPGNDALGDAAGAAYVFQRDLGGTNAWGLRIKLVADDGAFHDYFGTAVAVSGNTAMVGAPGVNGGGVDRGTTYVFERNSPDADGWGQKKTLASTVDSAGYGVSVALDADIAVVGASNAARAAYVYQRNVGGNDNWGGGDKLTGTSAASDAFGSSVAVSGTTPFVGAPSDGELGTNAGAAYAFSVAAPGMLDGAFSGDGHDAASYSPYGAEAYAVVVEPDNDAVVVGASIQADESTDFLVTRYKASNGARDASFNGGAGWTTLDFGPNTDRAYAVDLVPSTCAAHAGKILVAGYSWSGSQPDWAIARLNADGTPDATFGPGGMRLVAVNGGGMAKGIKSSRSADCKVYVGGYAHGYASTFALLRLNADGSIDTTFGNGGFHETMVCEPGGGCTSSGAESMTFQGGSPSRLLLGGFSRDNPGDPVDFYRFAMARYNVTGAGALDNGAINNFGGDGMVTTSFGSTGSARVSISTPDNSTVPIVMAGFIQGSTAKIGVAVYKLDGTLDPAFDGDGMVTSPASLGDCYGYAGVVQSGGKILVGGQLAGNPGEFGLLRFNANGTVDTSFDGDGWRMGPPSGPWTFIQGMDATNDGRFVAVGGYTALTIARYWQ
jgi:uncharacterized delta-60 repeat protein